MTLSVACLNTVKGIRDLMFYNVLMVSLMLGQQYQTQMVLTDLSGLPVESHGFMSFVLCLNPVVLP